MQVDFLESDPDYVLVHCGWRRFFVEKRRLTGNSMYQTSELKDGEAYFDVHYMEKYECSRATKVAATTRSAIQLLGCAYASADSKTANAMLAEYRELGIPIPPLAYLLAFGSRGRHHGKLVRPLIKFFWDMGENNSAFCPNRVAANSLRQSKSALGLLRTYG
ncbi:MAG TPA: hypothetical protein VFC44_21565 [Candidatus Saccharimonadales bacterium]|nr:hypothetical protein [Candidatus Saccharimonadales bacterium]